jgi:copper chaperone NosL
MRRFNSALIAGTMLFLPLAGCDSSSSAAMPVPVVMTDEAVGYYCQMDVIDHDGPKAQIHLKGIDQPLWFAQVSDAVAYLHDKERTADIVAVFVSDMEKAPSWSEPGPENWLDADKAFFVTDSKRMGGMGTPEAVPFGSKAAASDFAAREGGTVVTLADIPEDYARSPNEQVGMDGMPDQAMHMHGS